MSAVTINGLTVLALHEVAEFDSADTEDERLENKLPQAERAIRTLLVRYGVTESTIASVGGAGRQDDLKNLAAAIVLRAYFADVAKEIGQDTGFAAKAKWWREQEAAEVKAIFGSSPVGITTSGATPNPTAQQDVLNVLEILAE